MDFERAPTPVSMDRRSFGAASTRTTSLNDKLNTDYVDIGRDENSFGARYTRVVTGFVGEFVTPRQLLVVLRLLKAVTFCFLILTVCADIMYITFLEVLADKEVKNIVGGRRDMIIRVYGLFLAVVAIAIEVDVSWFVKSFYGFKGFVARAFLLFFISAITGAHPLQVEQKDRSVYHFNDAAAGDDAVEGDDAAAVLYDDVYLQSNIPEIPGSAVVFQMVTSFVLGMCAITYFVFGLLCLDRFTSKAYLSSDDPLVSTAIPTPSSLYQQAQLPESDPGVFRPPQPALDQDG